MTENNKPTPDLFTVVVTCVVLYKYPKCNTIETLILKRGNEEKEGPGLWTVPGGKVEQCDLGDPEVIEGSTIWRNVLLRAIIREVREETSIHMKMAMPIPHKEVVFERGDGTLTLVLTYCSLYQNKPTIILGDEVTEYQWVEQDELHKYEFINCVREDILTAMQCVL